MLPVPVIKCKHKYYLVSEKQIILDGVRRA